MSDNETIGNLKKKWEEEKLAPAGQKLGMAKPPKIYTQADVNGYDFTEDVGFPGEFPFAAGRHTIPIVTALWGRGKTYGAGKVSKTIFGYSGCGTSSDLRDFYETEKGKGLTQRGPNIAFDLPTQIGLDSDDERSEGEVGRVGVAIDTLKDFETIYENFKGERELDQISSKWTINGTTNIILAMYIALAEKRKIPLENLKGVPQNDILKEFIARGTQVFPVEHSMRMTRDTITYCTEHMPRMYTISISGFHMREAGASRIQAIAFTFSNAMAYFNEGIQAGLDIDEFVGNTTFLNFGGGMEVFKEAAARRAARIVWAKIMRDRFKSKNRKHWIFKEPGGALAGYWSSTKQRPLNNLIRVAIGAVFSTMIGDPPVLVPPFDEPLGLGHSNEATQLAADAARIIVEECKLCDVQDPLSGSYYFEHLTKKYTNEIFQMLEQIDDLGGPVKLAKEGWFKNEIVKSSIAFEKRMATGEEIRVGVNKYTEDDEIEIIPKLTPMYGSIDRESVEKRQLENLKKIKQERNNTKVKSCLEKIENAAKIESVNLIPLFVDAAKEYTTIGEICGALKNVFGEAL